MKFVKLYSIALGSFLALSPLEVLADTVYFGGEVKGKETPAYIVFDKIKTESKYHNQIPSKNDPNYDKILQKRNNSLTEAIKDVANKKGYDVVVEKNDPEIKGYVDISNLVISQLKENEK